MCGAAAGLAPDEQLVDGGALGRHVAVMERVVLDAELGHELERRARPAAGGGVPRVEVGVRHAGDGRLVSRHGPIAHQP